MTAFPSSDLPPSGAPGPVNWNAPEAGADGTGGWLDQLMALVNYRDEISADPTANLNLLISLISCPEADLAAVNQMLSTSPDTNAMLDSIPSAITELAENAYFNGYDGQTGMAAWNQWCSDALNSIPAGSSNPYITAIQSALQTTQFSAAEFNASHCNATTGALQWTDNQGVTWNWSSTEGQYQITQMMDNAGPSDTEWANNLSSIQVNYQEMALQANLKLFENNPFLMVMWLQTVLGNNYESQESGQANVMNILNDTTTNYSDPLITDVQEIGSMTPAQAQAFQQALESLTNIVGTSTQLSPIASAYQATLEQLTGTQITNVEMYLNGSWQTGTISPPVTLGQILSGATITSGTFTPTSGSPTTFTSTNSYTFDNSNNEGPNGTAISDLSADLNLTNPTPGGDPSNTTTSAAYQTITSVAQQIGALFSNQSKTVSTMISTVTNMESQAIQLGKKTVSSYQQLINPMLQNQTKSG